MNTFLRLAKSVQVGAILLGSVAMPGPGAAQQPLTLFNGTSLLGWNAKGSWSPAGGIISSNGMQARSLMSDVMFADFTLNFDYNETIPVGAKLRIWSPHQEPGGSTIDLDIVRSQAGVGGIEGSSRSNVASVSEGWHHVQVDALNGRLTVHIDNLSAGNGAASGSGSRAGYIGFEASGSGTLQLRNLKLVPNGLTPAFNGTDLGAWKSVANAPKAKGGLGHDVEKTLTFGIGGGSTKAHSAKWTVQNGALHGEDGPGGLEYATPFEDAIIELSASVRGQVKPEHFTSLSLRNAAGQLEGGYSVGVGPFSEAITSSGKRPAAGEGNVQETIIISGRTIAVWLSGNLTTVNTDSRPDASKVAQGAKVTGGVATLLLPGDGVQINVQRISITPLIRGGPTPAALPPVTTQSATQPATTAIATPQPSPVESALLEQQKAAQKQTEDDRQAKQKVASLMAMALSTTDPVKQMSLYNQVVQIDPANAPAVQGYKDAQAKVTAAQSIQDQQIASQVNQQHKTLVSGEAVNESLVKAQSSFLAGHLSEASSALSVAERLDPGNPLVRDLRSRISATSSLHSRVAFLAGSAGVVAVLGAIALWIRRRRQQRFPMLEITQGLEIGEQFPLEKDLVRIGAIAQDGGQKNDIVVRDVDRLISRFHCEIARRNGQLYITDLKSANGTKLDGVPLDPGRPMLLRRGSRILLGEAVELRFGFDRRDAHMT